MRTLKLKAKSTTKRKRQRSNKRSKSSTVKKVRLSHNNTLNFVLFRIARLAKPKCFSLKGRQSR